MNKGVTEIDPYLDDLYIDYEDESNLSIESIFPGCIRSFSSLTIKLTSFICSLAVCVVVIFFFINKFS